MSGGAQDPRVPRPRAPRWLRLWGWCTAPGAFYGMFAKFWQSFPLTRERPLFGFGSFEGSGGLVLLLLPLLGLYLCWVGVVVVKTGMAIRRRVAVLRGPWAVILVSLLLAALARTRETTWDRLFVTRVAATPEGPEAFMRAAAQGDVSAVRAFQRRGIPLESCLFGWSALHAAAHTGQLTVVRYLVDQGVRVNAVSASANTAVDEAEREHHPAVVAFLRARGGKEYDELAPQERRSPCAE